MAGALAAALCLVLVLEGLFLFVSPNTWKRMAEQMQQVDQRTLRLIDGGIVIVGLAMLRIVH